MELEEAIKILIEIYTSSGLDANNETIIKIRKEAIETVLQAFKDDEKIINEMSKYLASITDCPRENANADLDCQNVGNYILKIK